MATKIGPQPPRGQWGLSEASLTDGLDAVGRGESWRDWVVSRPVFGKGETKGFGVCVIRDGRLAQLLHSLPGAFGLDAELLGAPTFLFERANRRLPLFSNIGVVPYIR